MWEGTKGDGFAVGFRAKEEEVSSLGHGFGVSVDVLHLRVMLVGVLWDFARCSLRL